MAKNKNKKRATQTTSSSENIDATLTQAMAALTISSDLLLVPYHPRAAPRLQDPPQQLQYRRRQKRNIVAEFERYFGEISKLENWQRLCADVGIEDDLPSLTQCKKALNGVWVNIFDLLDAAEAGVIPYRFPTEKALAKYTREEGKVYPKKKAKEGGPVRALLAHIFRH